VIPATLIGFANDPKTGLSRALLSSEDDVYSLGVGEIVLSRFRVAQIGSNTVELVEVSSGRRGTLTLVENQGTQ
jgi:hypothetical protein